MEDINDPFERERLRYPFSPTTSERKTTSIWEVRGSRAQWEVVALPSSEEAHFIQERGKKQQVGVETSRFLDVVDES